MKQTVISYVLFFLFTIFGFQTPNVSGQTNTGKLEIGEITLNRNGGSAAVSTIFCMGIDGFPWYTTSNGIVKYYGTDQITHTFNAPPEELGANPFFDIYQSREGFVWVATSIGLYRFNEETGKGDWLQLCHPDTDEILGFRSIFESKDGSMFFATNNKFITRFDSETGELKPIPIPEENYVVPSSLDNFDNYKINFQKIKETTGVVFTQFNKVFTVENDKITVVKVFDNINEKLQSGGYITLLDNGVLMPEGTSGVYNHNRKEYSFKYVPVLDAQTILLPSRSFQILNDSRFPSMSEGVLISEIYATNSGVINFYVLDKNTKKLQSVFEPLVFERSVQRVFAARNAPLFVSTIGNAFKVRFTPMSFNTLLSNDKLPDPSSRISMRGMAEKSNGHILFATYNGLYEADEERGISYIDILSKNGPDEILNFNRSLYIENDSILWNLGETRRLLRINLNTKNYESFPLESDATSKLLMAKNLVVPSPNEFLIGTNKGVYRFDNTGLKGQELTDFLPGFDLSNFTVTDIYVDTIKQVTLVATINNGLFYKDMRSGEVHHFSSQYEANPFPANTVYVIHKANEGTYYLGTDNGLIILNEDLTSWQHYDKSDGISDNIIVGILEDNIGIWLSTFKGLTCYHKKEDWFYSFYEKDGLPDNEFNQESYFKSNKEELFFGGLNGAVYFKTRDLTFKKSKPQIKVVSAQFYDEERDEVVTASYNLKTRLDKLILPYSKTFLDLKFAISDLFSPEGATYEYMIEEINPNWIDLGTSSSLRLNALSPGKYSLRIRGDDSSGSPTTNEVIIPIEVEQIFYKSTWFIIINVLGLVLLLVGFYEFRKYRWKEKYRQQRQVDQLEAKALRAQMNPHFMFNALNGLQSTMILKGEREANKYLGSFSKLLRSSLDMSRTDTIKLSEEIEYLEAYLNLEKMRQARPLTTTIKVIPEDLEIAHIDIPCMLFQPILENAILHGIAPKREGEAHIDVLFKEEDGQLIGVITDNGIGRKAAIALKTKNKKAHKSWATQILKERIEIINRYTDKNVDLKIIDLYEGETAVGTQVILKLPRN